MHKFKELTEEFRLVASGQATRALDSALPLVLFSILYTFSEVDVAVALSVGLALLLAILRAAQRKSLVYAISGLGGVLLAAVFVYLRGSGTGFFIPGLLTGAATVILCLVSVVINRPLVAWTSALVRRWPLPWYWHPQVLPAYREVTLGWGVVFAFRLSLEYWLLQQGTVEALGLVRLLLGWPLTIGLLILSYLYGIWRLRQLKGPSVEEFQSGALTPWEGQQRGF
jgi:hypothetical protein